MKPPLPDSLPADPLPLVDAWIKEAEKDIKNATAMALATVDADGLPAARMVICRGFDATAGWLVFYTDRSSRKGDALARQPYASCVFHWHTFERQIRIDGPVTLAPDGDSDAYWQTRPRDARLAATASNQSQPIASRAALLAKVNAAAAATPGNVPRPSRWGGYRVWAERVELWVGQPARIHDRACWTRKLRREGEAFVGGEWESTRLQP
jgi:pyridoxamine 5'-phosphate oxidase